MRQKITAYWELSKPSITMLVLVATLLGYYLALKSVSAPWDWPVFLALIIGSALTSGGVATLNEYMERDIDRHMRRTRHRPLPSGRIRPFGALAFGALISLGGIAILTLWAHPLTGLLAAATLVMYIFIYTPLKRVTTWNTIIGAVPGALPPLGAWIAVTGDVEAGAWAVFAILFTWQIPHFLAIAEIYKEDYGRGGFRMMTTVDPTGRSVSKHLHIFSAMLLVSSIAPTLMGITGWLYLAGAVVLGMGLYAYSAEAARRHNAQVSKKLLLASIVYLPALLALMVLDLELFA